MNWNWSKSFLKHMHMYCIPKGLLIWKRNKQANKQKKKITQTGNCAKKFFGLLHFTKFIQRHVQNKKEINERKSKTSSGTLLVHWSGLSAWLDGVRVKRRRRTRNQKSQITRLYCGWELSKQQVPHSVWFIGEKRNETSVSMWILYTASSCA